MQYVKQVIHDDGHVDRNLRFDMDSDPPYMLNVYDTRSKEETLYRPGAVMDLGFLGVGISPYDKSGLCVSMEQKSVMLHDYVNFAESGVFANPAQYRKADSWSEEEGLVQDDTRNSVFNIFTGDDMICVCGESGSVATLSNRVTNGFMLLSLFDMLSLYCSKCDYNILRYETIQFCSARIPYRTVIRLLHGVDADRYFMKMYLEAVGCK